ncbi:pepsin/retropepsin-like aspartic protease family protein [Hyphobacterium sp. HN65]|uniref:Pepsin/retropepsin-like aspartic protease family protein n=1 Tax=Hyphobacterium lacteum TaxID=3116575 RepID=A0ABU7LN15_9PROT|nr:pepsin/retropepsin-like aspartic protease family protein [Hyphobacterium sp. HN65]MEE2525315.1 pepsin/retropepsin-like aspartic protease family protein [Hyphobacterium sp. HN65]
MRLSAALLGIGLMASAPALAGDVIELRQSYAGHYVVPTTIGGRGPFPFILDTGANHTAILEALAYQLNLSFEDGIPETYHGLTGSASTVILGLSALDFGAGPSPIDRAITIDAEINADLVAFGILGTDVFGDSRVEIDLAEYTLEIDPSEDWGQGRFNGYIDRLGMMRVNGSVNGIETVFVVDTGATRSFINEALAEAIMTDRQFRNIEVMGLGPQTGRAGEVHVGTIRFSDLCVRNARALATDFPIFETFGLHETPAMIIGLDLLDHGQIRIDFGAGTFNVDSSAACRRRSTSLFERNAVIDQWQR